MTREEEILQAIEHDIHYYGNSARSNLLSAMQQYAREMSIGFLLDTTGDIYEQNADRLYDTYLESLNKKP